MTVIRYPRHFAYLAVGGVALYFSFGVHYLPDFLGMNGLLHATAVVLALRRRAPWLRGIAFVVLTGLLGYAVVFTPDPLPAAVFHFVGYTLATAVNAAAYWFLVRKFWIHDLARISLLHTVALCCAVTLVWETYTRSSIFRLADPRLLTAHTICWWFAFSLSLYIAERKAETRRVAPIPFLTDTCAPERQ